MHLLSSYARSAVLGFIVVVAAIAAGCAAERDPINHVQAAAIDKAFFVGALADPTDDPEFYMRTTVVDVAAGAGSESLFTNSDAMTLVRVRWEITETQLLARLTYEEIENTDHAGRKRVPNGQVVAAYAIQKHFDVRREYNPQTGEELNILGENDTDRPWYQRESMRVDWAKNLITDAYTLDTLSQIGIYDGIKFDPVAYYVSDPASPDAPVFDSARGYFDVTNKVFASPQLIHDPDWGDFPSCELLGAFPRTSCNPSEVTLRQSFLRVEDHDYEALDYEGNRMDTFGFFSSDRYGYDRRYGVIDDRWHRFASRWNIWEKSHAAPVTTCGDTTPVGLDPHRDLDKSGTEDECESVGRGSKCDTFRGECTLPIRDRKVKTTAWYVNEGFPEELFSGTKDALDAWSDSIRVAVLAGRLAECRRTKDADCETAMGWPARWADDFVPPVGAASSAEVPRIFVLCHNPVDEAKDDAICGTKDTKPRVGDLRYNIINLIQSPQVASPWGISMDAEDPLTGEKIAASVNQWGAVLDRAAATLVDLLGLLNGELDPTQYVTGQNVSDWVKANKLDAVGQNWMSAEELASRRSALEPQALAPYDLGANGKKTVPRNPSLRHKNRVSALVSAGRMGPGNNVLGTRLALLKGSQIEAAMVTPQVAQAAGFDPTSPITKPAITRGSPFGKMNPTVRRSETRAALAKRAANHGCRLEASEPDNLLGLAKVAAKLFPAVDGKDPQAVNARRDQVYLWARQQYSNGVFAHEMGHTMGLRHNFAASFDSLNYRPQYWQLRTRNGTAVASCADGTVDGSLCVGPRWRDPISKDEIDGNIGRYATTSVMDYPGDQNQDQLLLGKYDRAAMRFGYGDVVDVWASPELSVKGSGEGKRRAYELTAFATTPGLFGVFDFPPVDPTEAYRHLHYSLYQKEFGILGQCKADTSANAIFGQTCSELPLDVVSYRDMNDFAADPALASYSFGVAKSAVDAGGRVRRGYMFSSDEFADTGNVPSFRYDAGADAYEQVRFLESAYENRYILDSFRRNRVEFDSENVTMRTQAHYLDAIQLIAKTFAFGAVLDGDPTAPSTDFMADGNYGALAMASTVAFDMFARIMTRPEPGKFCDATSTDCVNVQPPGVDTALFIADSVPYPGSTYDFQIPLGAGRYVHTDFDYAKGYWWSDYQTQVGTYYDKIWATYYLAEAFDSFVSSSKEDFTDGRYKNVSFATVYPEQVRRLFANVLTGDLEAFAPWVAVDSVPNKTPPSEPQYPQWHDAQSLGTRPGNAKLVDANYAFNEQLYAMVWGAIYFPTNWSMSWINDARITALSGEQITWPANETYVFVDPKSSITYRAHAIGTEKLFGVDHQRGIGARVLEWANKLTALAYVTTQSGGKPVFNANGTPALVLDGNGKAQLDPNGASAFAQLAKYVANVDILRQLTSTFNRPLDDGNLPQP
ncbi:hypothetical protein BH09MYX1_BH09MYX1_33700 [soil metagenome]